MAPSLCFSGNSLRYLGHGIGALKRDELPRYKSPVELQLMRAVKAALDPLGIMNPGKIL